MEKWQLATQKLQDRVCEPKPLTETAGKKVTNLAVSKVARDLEKFLKSEEGKVGLALLKISERSIFVENGKEGGSSVLLDGVGFKRCVVRTTAEFGRFDSPEDTVFQTFPVSAKEVVEVFLRTKRDPEGFLPWLRNELDEIADTVK